MPGDQGGAEHWVLGRDRDTDRADDRKGCSHAHSLGQRAGVYRKGCQGIADRCGGEKTLYIEPGSPWENGYIESFTGKLRDELLNREVFYTLMEVKALTAQYRLTYNRIRPHSSLGYRPPAPENILPTGPIPAMVGLT